MVSQSFIHSQLRGEMANLASQLRGEMTAMETRIVERMERMQTNLIERMERTRTDTIRWMFIFWVGQFAAIAGILFALLAHR